MTTQPATTPRILLTVEQAAAQLSIGRTRMFALLKTGQVDSVQIGRSRRVPLQALVDFTARLARGQGHAA
ncbi:helix-turn-helix domain-containing protein [Crossiella sp. SN42]|uniref:helix-turn-helix domain-containing protein n=1 Tax=Crossiella sp. SN42 TaxID=2944808 RepID=UPI00207CA096|nr:helix-turn-helix domain-containing protein [Crossiella sp. SN42]MCO1582399.1 helix-turn-helix domain-containing protein [Crossiella sp. SN42]